MENERKKKVFISGCGRSGTTMLLRLFKGFNDTHVHLKEAHFDIFPEIETDKSTIVIKRRAGTHKTLQDIPDDILMIHSIRHPYDVLISFHPGSREKDRFYISCDRWESEFDAYMKLLNRKISQPHICLKYEDLVNDPNRTQKYIENFTDLKRKKNFSEIESLRKSSLGKYKNNEMFSNHLRSLPSEIVKKIEKFSDMFGYDLTL